MTRFRIQELQALESGSSSPGTLRDRIGDMILGSTTCRAKVEAINQREPIYQGSSRKYGFIRLGNTDNNIFYFALDLATGPLFRASLVRIKPDEHILLPLTEEALAVMAGLFWDLGELPRPLDR